MYKVTRQCPQTTTFLIFLVQNVCVALQRLGGELVKAVAVVNVCVALQRFGGQ